MRLENSVVGRFNTGEKPSTRSSNSSCLLQRVISVGYRKAIEITVHSRSPKTTFNIGMPRCMLWVFFTSFVVHCIMLKNWEVGSGTTHTHWLEGVGSDNEEKYHTLPAFPPDNDKKKKILHFPTRPCY